MPRPWVNRRHRWVLAALVGIGLAVWLVRPSPAPPTTPAPSPRASSPAPRLPPMPPSTTSSAGEPLLVRITLPKVPTELSGSACTGWRPDAWRDIPVAPDGRFARLAVGAAQIGEIGVPPRWARAALDTVGLAPGDWHGLADRSPWFGYAALRIDHAWFQYDMLDRMTAAAQERGLTLEALLKLPPSEQEPVMAELRAELADRFVAHRALADTVAGADEAQVRSVAVAMTAALPDPDAAMPAERLLDPDVADAAKLAVVEQWCESPAGLGAAQRETLRAQIRASDDGRWAVAGAAVGLRDAWRDGDPAEVRAWAEDLAAARDRCLLWGEHGRFARDPRLSWDGAPQASRPEGFAAAAQQFAEQTGMTLVEARCDAPPCVARFDTGGPWRSYGAEANQIWGKRGHGYVAWGSDEVREVVIVAVNPDAKFTRAERSHLANARANLGARCLDEGQWSTVQAELADVVGPPQDWPGALRAAVFACHRDPGVGPSASLTAAAQWRGGWAFDPPGPLLDCVAERVQPPEPPAGTEITLQLWVFDPPR